VVPTLREVIAQLELLELMEIDKLPPEVTFVVPRGLL